MKKRLLTQMKWLMLFSLLTSGLYAADSLNAITGPTTITAGETVTVTVDYVASEERTIAIYMQSLNPKKMQFYKRINVQAGDELEEVSFTVPNDIPTAGTFRYKAYIAPKGGKWSSNLGYASQKGVKNVSNDNPALTREELIQYIKNWAERPTITNSDKIIHANTSEITDMSGIFSSKMGERINSDRSIYLDLSIESLDRLSRFNLNINSWNVSNVTDMRAMFQGALRFNQPLNNWDVSNVTDMERMFHGALTFNQPLNNWNVSNVTNMLNMLAPLFTEAGVVRPVSFNQDISNWDVSNATSSRIARFGALNDRYNPFIRAEFKQPNVWHNTSIEEKEGNSVVVKFTARPINYNSTTQMDTVIGFSDGEAQSYSDLGIIMRFSRDGIIDARDGDTYRYIDTFNYEKNTIYSMNIYINFDTHTYSLYAVKPNYDVRTIAKDFKFRTEQSDLSKINNVAQFSNKEGTSESDFTGRRNIYY